MCNFFGFLFFVGLTDSSPRGRLNVSVEMLVFLQHSICLCDIFTIGKEVKVLHNMKTRNNSCPNGSSHGSDIPSVGDWGVLRIIG